MAFFKRCGGSHVGIAVDVPGNALRGDLVMISQKLERVCIRGRIIFLVGEACRLNRCLRLHSKPAIENRKVVVGCKVVWIDPDSLDALKRDHPQIARGLRMATLVDEATLREWLLNVGGRTSIERVAHLFSELLLRLQVVGLGSEDSYELPVSQAELADTTGMSHVHVNRTLKELRGRGLIQLSGKSLTILKLAELRALAEFKPNYLHLGERSAA